MGIATRFYPLQFSSSRIPSSVLAKFKPYDEGIHDTKLFRSKSLIGLSKVIINKFPNGVPIYNMACSYGHEPYSVSLLLAEHLGGLQEVADKYPIIASDRADEIIDTAKSQILWIDEDNLDTLKQFKAHEHFINPIKVNDGVNEFQVSDQLFKTVTFSKGNILDEVRKLSPNTPVVLLTRNLWYYLDDTTATNLVFDLNGNLASGSILSMGNGDSKWHFRGRYTVGDYFAFIDHIFDDISNSLEEKDTFWEKTTFQKK